MATQIKFGTSGWRAVIADEFTLGNVRRAVTGIARYISKKNPNGAKLVIGRDPRFMGETLVQTAADIATAHGIDAYVIPEPAPTPAISYAIRRLQTDGGINFTASHNPPQYNGIKFSTPDGAPALPEVTKQIEAEIAQIGEIPTIPWEAKQGNVHEFDARPDYLKRLAEVVDLNKIKQSGLKFVFDPFWGAARGYSDSLLRDHGIPVESVHDYRDVLFGGHAPEPDGELLDECREKMRECGAKLGIATDGDADRFGIVDEDGTYIQPNYVIAMLFDYLVQSRGWKNGVAKSVATTNMINALADKHGVQLYETPVGFKFIGELINKDAIAIGGEESAGLTVRHHVPEKDGIIAGLLVAEMVAARGENLRTQLHDLFAQVGSFYPVRENFRLTDQVKQNFTKKLQSDPRELAGRNVKQVVRTDGLKLIFDDGSWVCYRLSGTEPVVRVYTEATSEADSSKLTEAAKAWVLQA
ncbi:MAG TPA: phosphoglucomutase/phosphomannomutase family protein [Terriglobales bacterium]